MSLLACQSFLLIMTFAIPNLVWANNDRLSSVSSRGAIQVEPQHTWIDLKLPQKKINQLQALATTFRKQRSMKQSRRPSRPQQSSAMMAIFVGPNQNAKLTAAEAIALELNRPLLKINVKRVVSRYIGETEKNIDSIFRKAKPQRAILFFDVADALFGKRTDVAEAHDRYANQEVSYLLQLMKRYPGLMIVSTKNISSMQKTQITKNQSIITFPCKHPRNCDQKE